MKLPSCPRTLIINILRKHPDGLTLTSIAQLTGLHRHTATKYVYELKGAGIINERDVGSAKLCYLRERLGRAEEKRIIGRLNGSSMKKSSTGQAQILTALLFLFLIPTTAMVAHNTSQVITADENLVLENINVSEVMIETENPETTQSLEEETPQEINITPPEELSQQNETISEENLPAENQTVIQENETNISVLTEEKTEPENKTAPVENETYDETVLPDEGILENQTRDNLTDQETENPANETMQEPAIEPPAAGVLEPALEARIISPDRITRGEEFDVSAIVKNTGSSDAKNALISWEIPSGFDILSGEAEGSCGPIAPGSECVRNLTLSSSLSTDTGRAEFRVLVKYEK